MSDPSSFVALPRLNALLEVAVVSLGRAFAARVVVAEGAALTVGATQVIGVPPPPPMGTPVTIRWSGRRGRYSAGTVLTDVDATQFAVWTLQVTGGVEIEQRRRFVRAPAEGSVQINPAAPTSDVVLVAELIDISEGAIRLRLPGKGIDETQPLQVRLQIGDGLLSLKATVMKIGVHDPLGPGNDDPEATAAEQDPTLEAVLRIEPDETQAKALRRYVMDLQRRERALKAAEADDAV